MPTRRTGAFMPSRLPVRIAGRACGSDATGTRLADEPMAATARLLREGAVVAIKGLGGFHLACDARNAAALATLRRRKHRDAKPFAVMATEAQASALCVVDEAALALLASPAAPIVLLPCRADGAKPCPTDWRRGRIIWA
jgi:hydrogenase maturation protein HypF